MSQSTKDSWSACDRSILVTSVAIYKQRVFLHRVLHKVDRHLQSLQYCVIVLNCNDMGKNNIKKRNAI